MRVVLRGLLGIVCSALVGVGAVGPAAAATVTVVMTGTWSDLFEDSACSGAAGCVLDGSIALGQTFTATLRYDDQTPDGNSSGVFGSYVVDTSTHGLTFTSGNYTFTTHGPSAPFNGIGIVDNGTTDSIGAFFDAFSVAGPLAAGVSLVGSGYSDIGFVGTSTAVITSDQLTAVNWDLSLFRTDFYFFAPVTSRGPLDYIEFAGAITSLTVSVAEPSPGWLVSGGLTMIALLRRRRA